MIFAFHYISFGFDFVSCSLLELHNINVLFYKLFCFVCCLKMFAQIVVNRQKPTSVQIRGFRGGHNLSPDLSGGKKALPTKKNIKLLRFFFIMETKIKHGIPTFLFVSFSLFSPSGIFQPNRIRWLLRAASMVMRFYVCGVRQI